METGSLLCFAFNSYAGDFCFAAAETSALKLYYTYLKIVVTKYVHALTFLPAAKLVQKRICAQKSLFAKLFAQKSLDAKLFAQKSLFAKTKKHTKFV